MSRDDVADWFGRRMEERPRRVWGADPPPPPEWDVGNEWLGGAHRMVMAGQQRDPYLPRVRLRAD
jgi:hypothetical protein